MPQPLGVAPGIVGANVDGLAGEPLFQHVEAVGMPGIPVCREKLLDRSIRPDQRIEVLGVGIGGVEHAVADERREAGQRAKVAAEVLHVLGRLPVSTRRLHMNLRVSSEMVIMKASLRGALSPASSEPASVVVGHNDRKDSTERNFIT